MRFIIGIALNAAGFIVLGQFNWMLSLGVGLIALSLAVQIDEFRK